VASARAASARILSISARIHAPSRFWSSARPSRSSCVDRDLAERGEPGAVTDLHHLEKTALIAASFSARKRAIVVKWGTRFTQITRNARSERHAASIAARRHARRVGVEQGGEHHLRVVGAVLHPR